MPSDNVVKALEFYRNQEPHVQDRPHMQLIKALADELTQLHKTMLFAKAQLTTIAEAPIDFSNEQPGVVAIEIHKPGYLQSVQNTLKNWPA